MSRLFFALWPDQAVRNEIYVVTEQLPKVKGRKIPPENIHITLAFLGQVGEQACTELQNRAAGIENGTFELTLNEIGWWKKSGILWLGAQSIPVELEQLVSSIKAILKSMDMENTIDNRKFVPHITLLRDVRRTVVSGPVTPVYWQVDRFVLVKSVTKPSGASYEVVNGWKLQT